MQVNVMLVVCDTLRKDVLGLYGGPAKTPYIETLAKEAVVYDNAIAPSPWTFPSHVSLFTGLYPNEHGVHETEKIKLLNLTKYHNALKTERVAEYFSRRGYETYGVSSNVMVSPLSGFDKGFKFFLSLDPAPKMKESKIFLEARKLGASPSEIAKELVKQRRFGTLFKYASAWRRIIKANKALNYPMEKGSSLTNDIILNGKLSLPFFYFINYVEMHEPYKGYLPKETWDNFTGIRKISAGKVRYLKKQYIYESEYLDAAIGRLVSVLKSRGVYDDTLLIITSDHGQAFNEHGYMYHNTYLYDEITRIPMIVKYPKNKKFKRRRGYQSLVHVPAMIRSILEGGDDSDLTKEAAFSEAYGDVTVLPGGYHHRKDYVKDKYEKKRKVMYKDDFKLTVNGTDGTIEEFLHRDRPVDPHEYKWTVRHMLSELDMFRGGERFALPDF